MSQILYVESQEENLILFKSQFYNIYSIHTAQNKKEALKVLSENKVNLVIIGLDIQERDTQKLVKKIKLSPFKPILILLTSCVDVIPFKKFIRKHDIFKVISKPYFLDEFKMVIRNGLQNYQLSLENKQTQELQHQNKMQRDILNALAYGVYLTDAESEIIFVNATMKKIIGHDIIGQKCYQAIYGLDRVCPHCLLKGKPLGTQKLKEEIVFKGETYLKQYTLLNKESRLAVYQNITERRRNEDKLNQLLREQKSLLAASPIGIIFISDQRVVWANEKMVDLSGYSREEMIGLTTENYYKSSADYKEVLQGVDIALKQGQIYRENWELKCKDGGLFWAEIIGNAINTDDLGQGSIWMINDISRFIVSEQKIQESEDKFHSIFSNSSDAIILAESTKEGAGKIVDINAISCSRLGYTQEELLEMTFEDITLPELVPTIKSKILGIAKGKKALIESVHVTKSGEQLSVEISLSHIELKGQKVFLLIVRDIGEHKKALERLNNKTEELKLFNDSMIHREMRVVELKKEVNRLSQELGRSIIYPEFWKEGADA